MIGGGSVNFAGVCLGLVGVLISAGRRIGGGVNGLGFVVGGEEIAGRRGRGAIGGLILGFIDGCGVGYSFLVFGRNCW